jgi:hypothetical protein
VTGRLDLGNCGRAVLAAAGSIGRRFPFPSCLRPELRARLGVPPRRACQMPSARCSCRLPRRKLGRHRSLDSLLVRYGDETRRPRRVVVSAADARARRAGGMHACTRRPPAVMYDMGIVLHVPSEPARRARDIA